MFGFSARRARILASSCLLLLLSAGGAAASVCGNGVVETSEECDPGGGLYIEGDPSQPTCTNGSKCFYENSCCKFNCQFVGQGAACNDGDSCTSPDVCNQVGLCVGTGNSVNGTPCDDGLYCNGTETCSNGTCGSSSGDPCPGTLCNTCQEATDTCVDPAGTVCGSETGCILGQCDGAGACNGQLMDGPCDDGIFCNGADTCAGGTCSVHAGDPCLGGSECADACQEETDSCNDPAGTACTDDGNACTDDVCNGSGVCHSPPNTAACDDGVFCNGADACSGGSCSVHAGNPCPDDVGCTVDACDEDADSCSNTPNDAACDDALYCNGPETCHAILDCQNAVSPCVDGNSCTVDNCNEATDLCSYDPLPELAACNDGSDCTIDDICVGGGCVGEPPLMADLCPWVLVEREDAKGDRIKTGFETIVGGDICGGFLLLGDASINEGDVVSELTDGRGAIRIGAAALMYDDIASGGGGAKGRPNGVKVPYTEEYRLDPGTVTPKSDATGSYDLDGSNPLVGQCALARDSFGPAAAALDALPTTANAGSVAMRAGELVTITVPDPGALNIIDIGDIRGSTDSVLEIDGGSDPATVVVLRVAGRLQLRARARIDLVGGLTPERLLIYVSGRKCELGDKAEGAGTLLCTAGRLKFGTQTLWTGALYGAGRLVRLGDRTELIRQAFQGF
ncbi:MAG TPA: hypothetical protein VEC57_19135 [Candidatus Limnocylindrales bacterium]|nr:hypothetical protein [Candidatus Limnocylindrales bacterium]